MTPGRSRDAIEKTTIFVVVVLLALGTIAGWWAYGVLSQPQSISTPTSSSTTSRSLGLRLTESINASTIADTESLNVSVSIFNTLSSVNSLSPSYEFPFQGVPVDFWKNSCPLDPRTATVWVAPGNLTLQGLKNDNLSLSTFYSGPVCFGVKSINFQPSSDVINFTTSEPSTTGPFHTALSFIIDGGWNIFTLDHLQPALVQGQPPPPVTAAFSPGVYTVAVDDEWGQVAILHVTIVAAPPSSTTSATLPDGLLLP